MIDCAAVTGQDPFHNTVQPLKPVRVEMNHVDTENLKYHQRIHELQVNELPSPYSAAQVLLVATAV